MKYFSKYILLLSLFASLFARAMEYYEQNPQKIAMIKERGVGAVYNWMHPNGSFQKVKVVSIAYNQDGKLTVRMDPVDNRIIVDFENGNEFTYKAALPADSSENGGDWTIGVGSGLGSAISAGIVADSGLQDEINKAYKKIAELEREMGEDFEKVEQAKISLHNSRVLLKLKVDAILKTGVKPFEIRNVSASDFNYKIDQGQSLLKNIKWLSQDPDFLIHAEQIRSTLIQAKINSTIDQIFFDVAKSSLVKADQQSFLGHKDDADWLVKIAKVSADVFLGLDPFTGFARGVYETFTGKNLITDELLSPTDRALAILNLVSGGVSIAKIVSCATIIGEIIEHLPMISKASKNIFVEAKRILKSVWSSGSKSMFDGLLNYGLVLWA